MALGKNTTIGAVEDLVRFKTGTTSDERLTAGLMLDLINQRVADLAKKLSDMNAPFYMSTATLTFTADSAPVSSLSIDRIRKIVDSSLGLFIYKSPDDFERIASFSNLYTNSLFWTQEGETIRRTKGSGLGAYATDTIYYYRNATAGANRAAYPDLPDAYTSLLVKAVSSDVVAYLNKGQRSAAVDQEIAKDLEELRQGFLMRAA